MEAVSSEADIGRRRLADLDLEGVTLGSTTVVVSPMNVSEGLTEVIDGRKEEIGELCIGEANELVGSGVGVIGVVKGITGGMEVRMSTGVEKKKL